MTDRSVDPHAQVWAQSFTDTGDDPAPLAPRTQSTDGLYDAFPPLPGTAPAPDAPAEAEPVDDGTDFDDLFEELDADEPEAPATKPLAFAAEPPADDVPAEPSAGDGPGEPAAAFPAPEAFPTPETLPDPPAEPATDAESAPTSPAPPEPPSRTAVATPDEASEPRTPAGQGAGAHVTRNRDAREEQEYIKRYKQAAVLQPFISHLQALIAATPQLSELVRGFVLTSERNTDLAQQRQLTEALTAVLVRAPKDVTSKMPPQHHMHNVLDMLYDDVIGIGPLGPLWRDERVTEIIVRGPETVLVERAGESGLTRDIARFRDLEHLQSTARNLAHKVSGRALSPTSPLVTAELPGARVQFVYAPLTRDGVFIAIRKFRPMLSMQALIDNASLTDEMAAFLADLVTARATIVVSGGTGSGKTSMINALSEFIDHDEHVLTIEDSYELKLDHPNVTALQTKEKSSADDTLLIAQADLLVAALRMRPDRIIVGEIREGRGADTMMRAAGTGHDGSMTTIHANDPAAAMSERLPDLLLEHKSIPMETARRSVANAIDAVVHVAKRSGRRYVSAISVVSPAMVTPTALVPTPIFTYDGYTAHRVGGVDTSSELGIRMVEAGVADRWRSNT